MTVAQIIVTSCSRRSLELEQIKKFLTGNGIQLNQDDWNIDPETDLFLLSTCGFTLAAENFGFETLHRINRDKKPSAQVVFGGCIPEINPERVSAEFGGKTFSPQAYDKLDDIVGARKRFASFARPNVVTNGPAFKSDFKKTMELLRAYDGSFSGLQYISRRAGNALRQRIIRKNYANLSKRRVFYIQVQEGCSMDCSYCAIKAAIGKLHSKPLTSIVQEFEAGLAKGFKEFQLVGDNAAGYGLDIGTNFAELLNEIAEIPGDFRLDLTDVNPAYLRQIAPSVETLLAMGKLARLYVPIQSASPRILKLMKRLPDMEDTRAILKTLRRGAPEKFRLGTSVIVGFPSETEDDVYQTIEFCREVAFDWVWCHSFSARPETVAARLDGHIPPAEILRRAKLVKAGLSGISLVTTAVDTSGSHTCQG